MNEMLTGIPTAPNYVLSASTFGSANKITAKITKDGIFHVCVEPTDETALHFIALVNQLAGVRLTDMVAHSVDEQGHIQ